MKAYKYIIRNHGSNRDINGNCYWYSTLINLKTRKQLFLSVDYESELSYILRTEYNIDSQEIYEFTVMFPIRKWDLHFNSMDKNREDYPGFMVYGQDRKNYIKNVL